RVEGVLPTGGYSAGLSRAGSVDRPKAADGATQTVDAGDDDLSGTAKARCAGAGHPGGGGSRPKLVENRRTRRDEYRHANGVPGGLGASEAGTALTSTFRTAGCGPACPVVWEGSSRL